MTKIYHTLCVLTAGVAMLTSCLNDNNDGYSSDYHDVAITQFTLGTLNRYVNTVSSTTGNDTVVKTTLTGSNYKMTIDHLQGRIYNVQQLPVGTDISHVICTVSTKNGGAVGLQSMTSDTVRYFSQEDSIDFSKPRVFKVVSASGQAIRDYTVELNVSATTGTTFAWTLATTFSTTPTCVMCLKPQGDSIIWECKDDLIGASTNTVYTIDRQTGQLMSKRTGESSWQTETLADADSLLPAVDRALIVSWPYGPADNTDYVLMVGNARQQDVTAMRVWRKIAPHEGGGQWVYMPVDEGNHYPLPLITQEYMAMAYYDGSVLIVDDDKVMRQSSDEGITWRVSSTYALPDNLEGDVVDMVADTQGRLWLLTSSGQLWRGFASE